MFLGILAIRILGNTVFTLAVFQACHIYMTTRTSGAAFRFNNSEGTKTVTQIFSGFFNDSVPFV